MGNCKSVTGGRKEEGGKERERGQKQTRTYMRSPEEEERCESEHAAQYRAAQDGSAQVS